MIDPEYDTNMPIVVPGQLNVAAKPIPNTIKLDKNQPEETSRQSIVQVKSNSD